MRLKKARVQKYRSIRDSGYFDVAEGKTILVGPNEAGKTALLEALQRLNPPPGLRNFDALRDYPRSEFDDILTGKVRLEETTIVEGDFSLGEGDKEALPPEFRECEYIYGRRVDNSSWHALKGGPPATRYEDIKKDLARLAAHVDQRSRVQGATDAIPRADLPSAGLERITLGWADTEELRGNRIPELRAWLEKVFPLVEEGNETEEKRYDQLMAAVAAEEQRSTVLRTLVQRLPVFVRFRDYFRLKPLIHLGHLAERSENSLVDDDYYDYGNQCLLRLLGFTARELSTLGMAPEPQANDLETWQRYRDQLDRRSYQLNAASIRLTDELRKAWKPDTKRDEAERLRIVADGQYLKVVVEDDLGIEIELDQRSEGFQWLVSFFVVFFAEAADRHRNAILLLDEPGLSLHGLKQQDFRSTISRLAEANQTLYTTHSPFLVGPDELHLVRIVEMPDRTIGTKVRTNVTAEDPAALLPLQEALAYDLAQDLFAERRNLVLESLTDYWYLEAVADLLRDSKIVDLDEKIALIPASNSGKLAYFAAILNARKLKVAALLDSDAAGNHAPNQDALINKLGNKAILRTKDSYSGPVATPRVEDMLRETLIHVAKTKLEWDINSAASEQPDRSIVEIFANKIGDFSRYKLAKAFLHWTRYHSAGDLPQRERTQWKSLIESINTTLK